MFGRTSRIILGKNSIETIPEISSNSTKSMPSNLKKDSNFFDKSSEY